MLYNFYFFLVFFFFLRMVWKMFPQSGIPESTNLKNDLEFKARGICAI